MNFLFFDIECCDGYHICSFGYVLTNENFEIIKKEDILINPEKPFKLARSGFDPNVKLAYPEYIFRVQKPFNIHFAKIKKLLLDPETILFGHSIGNDLLYLTMACERYDIKPLDLKAFDTQKMYHLIDPEHEARKLEDTAKELGVDISHLEEHKSCDDAEMTMYVAREICKKLNIDSLSIPVIFENCIVNGINKEGDFKYKLKKLLSKFPKRQKWPSICFSDTIELNDVNGRIELIKHILESGYDYTNSSSSCSYFVSNGIVGNREIHCDQHIANGKKIKKITIEQLAELLNVDITKNLELTFEIKTESAQTTLSGALMEALKKKGISIEEFFQNE